MALVSEDKLKINLHHCKHANNSSVVMVTLTDISVLNEYSEFPV